MSKQAAVWQSKILELLKVHDKPKPVYAFMSQMKLHEIDLKTRKVDRALDAYLKVEEHELATFLMDSLPLQKSKVQCSTTQSRISLPVRPMYRLT